jgi:hypothetical protein
MMNPYIKHGILGALGGAGVGAGMGYLSDTNIAAAAALGALGGGVLWGRRGPLAEKYADLSGRLNKLEAPVKKIVGAYHPPMPDIQRQAEIWELTKHFDPLRSSVHAAREALRNYTIGAVAVPTAGIIGASIYGGLNE